ncbi:PKD domain-containing protein [candidate division KSB1 bacterium]
MRTKSYGFILCFILLTVLDSGFLKAQCEITASGYPLTICPGEQVYIQSSGFCGYSFSLMDDFNTGTLGNCWSAATNPMFNNPCGPGLDSTIHAWMGSDTSFPRHFTTNMLDVSVSGCQVKFEMKYGDQQPSNDCEFPDLANEGVHLQYSVDTGATWTDINYWTPTYNMTGPLYTWNLYIENIPYLAVTTQTMFRWWQSQTSGNDWDHWGIDNCEIFCPASQLVQWSHGPAEFNPPPVFPLDDTMFVVTISDTVNNISASDTVWISVLNTHAAFTYSIIPDSGVVFSNQSVDAISYLWDFGDGTNSTSSSPTHVFTTGFYTVTLIACGNCNCDTITDSFKVINNSFNEFSNNDFQFELYPNPAHNIIGLSMEHIASDVSVKIFNILGDEVFRHYVFIPKEKLTLSIPIIELEKGVYLLKIMHGIHTHTERLILY